MRVDIRVEGCGVGIDERRYAERAVLLSLGRFQPRVTGVTVSVADVCGDSGEPWRQQVSVRLDGACRLIVVESGDGFDVTLLRALDRARRYVEREMARFGWRGRAAPRLAVVPPGGTARKRTIRPAFTTREDNRS